MATLESDPNTYILFTTAGVMGRQSNFSWREKEGEIGRERQKQTVRKRGWKERERERIKSYRYDFRKESVRMCKCMYLCSSCVYISKKRLSKECVCVSIYHGVSICQYVCVYVCIFVCVYVIVV